MKLNYQNYLIGLVLCFSFVSYSQVGVNTTNPQAQLDVVASNPSSPNNTDGFLVPRIDTFPATNPTASQQGMLVYLTTTVGVNAPGFYYWDNVTTSWVSISQSVLENDPQVSSSVSNKVPRWNGTSLVDGAIMDNGSFVGIGATVPQTKLHVVGTVRIEAGRLDFRNTGGTTAIGTDAGINDDQTNNYNTYVGYFSGKASTSGYDNVAIGAGTLEGNSTGYYNTAVGRLAGLYNLTGSRNVFLGYGAGYNETGSDKLYIDSSITASPLIYGDFATNLLKVNGTLNINNTYNLPITAGIANQVLQTDGVGNTTWVNPTSLSVTETDPQVASTTSNYIPKWNGTSLVDGQVFDNGTNVGIGTTTPTSKFEVVGTTSTTNFQMTNGATNGYVLQSNATGNATWVNPTSLSVTETDPQVASTTSNYIPKWNGTSLVDGQVFDNGTNVGLGTTLPTDKLHVVGNIKIENGKIPFINGSNSVYVGQNAGNNDTFSVSLGNIAIGKDALMTNSTSSGNTAVGFQALKNNTSNSNTAIGYNALRDNTTGSWNVSLGQNSLASNTTGRVNIGIGGQTLLYNTTGRDNIAIGDSALLNNTSGIQNVAIGNIAGRSNIVGSRNVFLGFSAGFNETGSDKLYIDNTNTIDPLIYGDFAIDLLKINGTLNINNAYNLPSVSGLANQVLQTDGSGNTAWVNPTSLSVTETDPQVASTTSNYIPKWNGTSLVDGQVFDNGTNVGVGTNTPSDKLHVVGNIKIDGGRIPFVNTGGSIFIGENSGQYDDLTSNQNVFIGDNSGLNNSSGSANIAIGPNASLSSTTGQQNVTVGYNSLRNNLTGSFNTVLGTFAGEDATGSRNVYIGYNAGEKATGNNNVFIGNNVAVNETGSNKLYIDNSNTTNPLIYGDFSSNILTVNGNLGIGTSSPNQAKLVVDGFVTQTMSYGYLNSSGATGSASNIISDYSIYASHRIAASEFNAFSDERIKNIKGVSDSKTDLQTLSQIQITNYTLKDSIAKGTNKYKKVIAQQVEKVYPQAVSTMTDVIPDIYKQAEMINGVIVLENNLKVGEKVKIILANDEKIVEVKQATSKEFTIDSNLSEKVFVYGRQVNDFHTVDYEALSTLNISATQELLKRIEQLEQENTTLKASLNEVSELKTEMENIKKMLSKEQTLNSNN